MLEKNPEAKKKVGQMGFDTNDYPLAKKVKKLEPERELPPTPEEIFALKELEYDQEKAEKFLQEVLNSEQGVSFFLEEIQKRHNWGQEVDFKREMLKAIDEELSGLKEVKNKEIENRIKKLKVLKKIIENNK